MPGDEESNCDENEDAHGGDEAAWLVTGVPDEEGSNPAPHSGSEEPTPEPATPPTHSHKNNFIT